MAIDYKNDKIIISQRNLNRMFYGTKQPWQVLRDEGATILVEEKIVSVDEEAGTRKEQTHIVRLPAGQQPNGPVVGIDLMEHGVRFMTGWGRKFTQSIPTTGEKMRVKECKVVGLPAMVALPPQR